MLANDIMLDRVLYNDFKSSKHAGLNGKFICFDQTDTAFVCPDLAKLPDNTKSVWLFRNITPENAQRLLKSAINRPNFAKTIAEIVK